MYPDLHLTETGTAIIKGAQGTANVKTIASFTAGFILVMLTLVIVLNLKHSRAGRAIMAMRDNRIATESIGINVTKYKYLATCVGAGISGLGGVFYVMEYTLGTWANGKIIEGLGWLAVALVIFASWKPVNAIWGSYLFGFVYWAYLYIPGLGRSTQELFKMLPYVITLVVLIVVSLRKKRENQPPASLGLSYFREER